MQVSFHCQGHMVSALLCSSHIDISNDGMFPLPWCRMACWIHSLTNKCKAICIILYRCTCTYVGRGAVHQLYNIPTKSFIRTGSGYQPSTLIGRSNTFGWSSWAVTASGLPFHSISTSILFDKWRHNSPSTRSTDLYKASLFFYCSVLSTGKDA